MDISSIDLNLLPVLDALLRQCSVTLAARELDMSQSAVSTALGRLRGALGDQLFVRTGHGMLPTPRTDALMPTVRDVRQGLECTVGQACADGFPESCLQGWVLHDRFAQIKRVVGDIGAR